MSYKATNIISPDSLHAMAEEFYPIISMKVTTDDPEGLCERITHLSSLMATTGKMLADAKYWKDDAVKNSVLTALKDAKRGNLPASTLNELIKADCRDFNYLVNWIEQLDKECKYQIEALRTLISLRKQEMATFNN